MAASRVLRALVAEVEELGNVGREDIAAFVAAHGGDQATYETYVEHVVSDIEDAVVAFIEHRESEARS